MGTLKAKVGGSWVPVIDGAADVYITEDEADDKYINTNVGQSYAVVGIWKGTQAQFDAIGLKDPNVMYVVI